MKDTRRIEPAQVLENFNEPQHVMTVNRTVVVEIEAGENARRRADEVDRLLLHSLGDVPKPGHGLQNALRDFTGARVGARRDDLCKMIGKRACGRRNRAVVVVEDDEKLHAFLPNAGIVQCLERHAARQSAVADHGNVPAVGLVLKAGRDGHAERGRDRR